MSWEKDGCEYRPIEGLNLLLQSHFPYTQKETLTREEKGYFWCLFCYSALSDSRVGRKENFALTIPDLVGQSS